MTNNIYTTRFRLILYQWSRKSEIGKRFYFDIYDEIDFAGNSLNDPDVGEHPSIKTAIDEDIEKFKKVGSSDYKTRLDQIARMPGSSHSLPPGIQFSKIDVNHFYIREFLKDKHSYYIKESEDRSDISKSINWKALDPTTDYKKINELHNRYLKKKLEAVSKLFTDKDLSLAKLIDNGDVDEFDITEAVKSISSYTVSVDHVNLEISFTLSLDDLERCGCPYIMENSVVDFYVDFVNTKTYDDKLYVGEYKGPATRNELKEIEKNLNDLNKYLFTRRFIGVVTSVEYDVRPGEIPICTIRCGGLSAYLGRFNMVKDQALMTFFENNKLDIQLPGLSVFQDNLNAKTIEEVLEYVLKVLYLSNDKPDKDGKVYFTKAFDPKGKVAAVSLPDPKDIDTVEKNLIADDRISELKGLLFTEESGPKFGRQGVSFYRRGWILLKNIDELFKEDLSNVAASYWVTYLYFKVREKFRPEFINLLEKTKKEIEELEKSISAKIESGVSVPATEESSSDLQRKIENKRNIVETLNKVLSKHNYIVAYHEGDIATIRAYNVQIKNAFAIFYCTLGTGREILDGLFDITHVYFFEDEPGTIVMRFPRINIIQLGNDGFPLEKFVIDPQDILSYSWSRNDFNLFSRQDYTPIMPLTSGDIVRFPWSYTDSQTLFKYGTRLAQKSTNPNATMFHMNYIAHFSAVATGFKNGSTRTVALTVANKGQRYCLGRTYFIPDPSVKDLTGLDTVTGWVATLHSMTYSYTVGSVPTIELRFTFARRTCFKRTKTT
jgi:hypothetical protein